MSGTIQPEVVGSETRAPRLSISPALSGTRATVALGSVLLLTMLPVTMMVPVLKELVAHRFGVSSFWVHLFMSINLIGAIATLPVTAALADRMPGRRGVLLAGLLLNGVTLALMPLAPTFALFMLLRFFEGALHMLAVTTIMAGASDWSRPGQRGRQMGLIGAALILGTACGAPLGGVIGQRAPQLVFVVGVAVIALACVIALFVTDCPDRRRASRLAEVLGLLKRNHGLRAPYAFAFADRLCVGVIISSFVLYLSDIHHYSPAGRGGLLALFLFPFALLCYPAGRLTDRWGRTLPIALGNAAFGVTFWMYGFVPAAWLPLLMLASGVFSAMMFTPSLTLCADRAPTEQRAAVFAGFNIAGSLGFLSGPLLGGCVHALLGDASSLLAYRLCFILGGAAPLACAIAFLCLKPARRSDPGA